MKAFITGSRGLIGSKLVTFFDIRATRVIGVDSNMRADFFDPEGDPTWNLERLRQDTRRLSHHQLDIRDREGLSDLVKHQGPVDLIAHCAAQPSHDLAARRPFDDFDGNATVALNVLEATRLQCPEAVFVFMSTNKVYGAAPKELPLRELD
jgi:CDP-paratose 2-epimerase